MLKKGTLFLTIALLVNNLSLGIPNDVYANEILPKNISDETIDVEVTFTDSEIKAISLEREEIITDITKQVQTNHTSLDEVVAESLKKTQQHTLIEGLNEELEMINLPTSNVTLDTNLDTETYEINDNLSVTFDDNFIIVDEWNESDEIESEEDVEPNFFSFIQNIFSSPVQAAGTSKIKNASNSRSIYDARATSWKLVTAYISAEFTYNGTTVTARRTGSYMKTENGGGALIDIVDKKSEVQKPSSSRRVAYQEGTAIMGLTVKGHGLRLQERYLRVNVECNAKGMIKKDSILK
ncbi:hypothetical protein [Exiguobacterium profundum]|uniref:hypothetical protein n=1 Tax=Exiguobacterium profundum TaxID=307643 RepID=UPI002AA6FED9|nr:hypothetical protein [Exiguobacterium profundum]